MNATAPSTPEAFVVSVNGLTVTLQCPYCSRLHEHKVRRHGHQRLAPACGMYRSGQDRLTGYQFTTKENTR